jgi:DNA-binding PadR family transcriptional regulator
MLDKIILGFLLIRDLTVYDVRKAMEHAVNHFYSSSLGSINPAMKKLESMQLVHCREMVEHGRLKKVYSITRKGRAEYQEWQKEPIGMGRIKEEVLVRLYFMGDAEPDTRHSLIRSYIDQLKVQQSGLEEIVRSSEETEVPESMKDRYQFQLSTVQFGIAYYQFAAEWFENLLKKI